MAWCVDHSKLFSPVKMKAVSEEGQEELTRVSDCIKMADKIQ